MSKILPDAEARRTLLGSLRPALVLAGCRTRAGRSPRLSEMLEALGPGGTILLAMLLALPFASPFSLGPITFPFAMAVFWLGLRVARGIEGMPTGAKWLAVPVPTPFVRAMRRMVAWAARRGKWHRRELAPAGEGTAAFRSACGWGMVAGALLLAVPVPFLPLTNTFCSLAVISFCLAHLFQCRRLFTAGVASSIVGALILIGIGVASAVPVYLAWSGGA